MWFDSDQEHIEIWDGARITSVARDPVTRVNISGKRSIAYNRISCLLSLSRSDAITSCMDVLSEHTGARCAVYRASGQVLGRAVASDLCVLSCNDRACRLSMEIASDPRMVNAETESRVSMAIPLVIDGVLGCLALEFKKEHRKTTYVRELEKLLPVALYLSQALDLEEKKRDIREKREEIEKVAGIARAKDVFLATMSHELRTPLSVMIGNLSMLANSLTLNDRDRSRLNAAITSGGQLSELIGDILDYVKLSAGRLSLRLESCDLRKIVHDTVSIFKTAFEEKGIEFVWSIASQVPQMVMADAQRIRQILVNFVSNALKFTDSGTVTVHVRATRGRGAGGSGLHGATWSVRFQVTDTGCGISRERQPYIFDDFYQLAADQLDGSASGIGLGLAISRRLVNLMKGEISVLSEPGSGSSFEFTVPLEESVDILRVVSQRKELLHGKHVLIVDDIPDNRNYLADVFLRFGCSPFVCSSASDAHMYLENTSFALDFAVYDVNMPGTNGVELMRYTARIRPELPVIALSSIGTDFDGNDVFDYISTKPIAEHQLLRLVLEVVQTGKRVAHKAMDELDSSVTPRDARVLVVEDNKSNLDMICDMLEEIGIHSVDVARNGREAVEAVRGGEYGLVLMDLKMPVMNGLDATREIKKLAPPHPRIIALTASVMETDKDRCLRAGMQGHISKPVTIESLRKAVEI